MRTLLVTIPNNMEEISGRAREVITPVEPFGLMYIASVLESRGREVEILDAFALDLDVAATVRAIADTAPDIVGLSCLTIHAHLALELIRAIRVSHPDRTPLIVAGNAHADLFATHFLQAGLADVVVHGEGELVMAALVDAYEQGADFADVPGISYRTPAGAIVRTAPAAPIADLDALPLPARHLVPMDRYRMSFYWGPQPSDPRRYKGMFTSRGCPYHCTFCTVHRSRSLRFHSVGRVMQELRLLVEEHGAEYVFFLDSCFMCSRSRVTELCDAIIESGLRFRWGCEGRVNLAAAHPELLHLMHRAGCVQVAYGIESGVQSLLDRVGKDCTLQQIDEAINHTVAAGIGPVGLFILGLPGETPEMTDETIRLSLSHPFVFAQYAILTPFPGTEIHDELVAAGRIDPMDWSRYSQYAAFTDVSPIYVPDGYDPALLLEKQRRAIQRFFFRPAVMLRHLQGIRPANVRQYLGAARTLLGWFGGFHRSSRGTKK